VDPLGLWESGNPATYFDGNPYGGSGFQHYRFMDTSEAAAATLDGIIPFWDPFADAGAYDKCDKSMQFSQEMGAFARDAYLLAKIPNLSEYVKNPRLYELGSGTVPLRIWNQIKNLSVVARGRWLLANRGTGFTSVGEFFQAYKATWNTGLTPQARLFVEYLPFVFRDALMRNTSSMECECKKNYE